MGCGAGNYTLKLLEHTPGLDATLIDLSRPMLDRATERVRKATTGTVTALQGDVREVELGEGRFDIVVAAAVLHHLRTDDEWRAVFTAFHRALRPGGSVWVFDLVESAIPAVQQLIWARYGEYLATLKDESYRDHVLAYVEKEDTPRPLTYQLDLLREVGFAQVDVLHKNVCFAAFGGVSRPGRVQPRATEGPMGEKRDQSGKRIRPKTAPKGKRYPVRPVPQAQSASGADSGSVVLPELSEGDDRTTPGITPVRRNTGRITKMTRSHRRSDPRR